MPNHQICPIKIVTRWFQGEEPWISLILIFSRRMGSGSGICTFSNPSPWRSERYLPRVVPDAEAAATCAPGLASSSLSSSFQRQRSSVDANNAILPKVKCGLISSGDTTQGRWGQSVYLPPSGSSMSMGVQIRLDALTAPRNGSLTSIKRLKRWLDAYVRGGLK